MAVLPAITRESISSPFRRTAMCLCQYEDEPEPTERIAAGSFVVPAPSDRPTPYVRTTLCARSAPAYPAAGPDVVAPAPVKTLAPDNWCHADRTTPARCA
ncbi:hypothetical protein [Streptomyces sp. SID13588]|nr:hypothetical protein [Streptomyces sp. SID13588]